MKPLLLCLVILLACGVPCIAQDAQIPFADVPVNHRAYQEVDTLQKAGIVMGDPGSAGNGRRDMTRNYFAVAIARLLPQMAGPSSQARADIEARLLASPPALSALQNLVRRFDPELTRLGVDVDAAQSRLAELHRTALRVLVAKPFADVPPTHWAASSVETLRQNGFILGYPGGAYTTR